jgi:hypothetical protein
MTEDQPTKWNVGDDAINLKELKRIHGFLSQTTRPSWHTPPPSNLGEASHGKLKADQWRSCMEFDVPAAMAEIWIHDSCSPEDERAQRQKKLVEATMLLATAIRWATSYRTSELHATQYMRCITAYLNILKELYPNLAWRPKHHAALHIGPFLLLYGPMHGWWMFVFERIIGLLQKININYKLGELNLLILRQTISSCIDLGELEGTMLKTFCASVNFKSLLLQHDDMPIVQKCRAVIEQATKDRSRDAFAGIMTSQVDEQITASLTPPKRQRQRINLSERALSALNSIYRELFGCPIPSATTCHSKYIIGKVTFTTRAESNRNCNIFFRSTAGGVIAPGVIQYIVSIPSPSKTDKMDSIFVIERYSPLPNEGALGPFSSYVAFGASLWSSKMSPALEAVPVDHVVCHAISRPWVKGVILFKALDRVSTMC